MNLLDARSHELAFGRSDEIQMGSRLLLSQDIRITRSNDLACHIVADFVAAGSDRGSDPSPRETRVLRQILESLLDDVVGQASPTRVDGGQVASTFDHDGHAVGGGDRQDRAAFASRQRIGLTAETRTGGLEHCRRVDLVGPGEPQSGIVNQVFEGLGALSLGSSPHEEDLTVRALERPCPVTCPKLWRRSVLRIHGGDGWRPILSGVKFRSH